MKKTMFMKLCVGFVIHDDSFNFSKQLAAMIIGNLSEFGRRTPPITVESSSTWISIASTIVSLTVLIWSVSNLPLIDIRSVRTTLFSVLDKLGCLFGEKRAFDVRCRMLMGRVLAAVFAKSRKLIVVN